jgi:hypothetical protein
MMPRRGRGQSGIDPAKDHRKPFGEDIGERVGHGASLKIRKN